MIINNFMQKCKRCSHMTEHQKINCGKAILCLKCGSLADQSLLDTYDRKT